MEANYTTEQLCQVAALLNQYGDAQKAYGHEIKGFENETHYLTTMSAQDRPFGGSRKYSFIVVNKD